MNNHVLGNECRLGWRLMCMDKSSSLPREIRRIDGM
jgi:hypothetical protein